MSKTFMQEKLKSFFGFSLIGVLLIISALVITVGGVMVWERRVLPFRTPTLTTTPSVTKVPTETPPVPTKILPTSELEAKKKCEASGGKWGRACSSHGCDPGYCACASPCSEEKFPWFDYFKDPSKGSPKGLVKTDFSKCGSRVEFEGACKDCQSDFDCGEVRYSQGRAYCFEYKHKCINGVCYDERFIYAGYNLKSSGCQNTCGDNVCDNFEIILCPEDCK